MADRFRKTVSDIDSPAEFAFAIPDMHVPDGSSTVSVGTLSITTRAIYVGNTGNIYCRMANTHISDPTINDTLGANVHFQNVPAGTILPIRVQAIWANNQGESPTDDTSNTTARGLIGLY